MATLGLVAGLAWRSLLSKFILVLCVLLSARHFHRQDRIVAMEFLASTASAFAVVSLAVQLAESANKLYEFWASVKDAPDAIQDMVTDLEQEAPKGRDRR